MAKRNRNYVVERILLCKKDNIQSCRRKIKFGDHSVPTRNVETMEVEKDVPGTEFSLLLSSKVSLKLLFTVILDYIIFMRVSSNLKKDFQVSEHVRNRLTEHRYRNLNVRKLDFFEQSCLVSLFRSKNSRICFYKDSEISSRTIFP